MGDKRKACIECGCGCGEGITVREYDEKDVSIEFRSSGFCAEQGRLFPALRKDVLALTGKPVTSFLVTADDLRDMLGILRAADYETDTYRNDGHIVFSWDRDFGYTVELYSSQKKRDIIAGKRYRCYALQVGKRDAEKMAGQIEAVLAVGEVFPSGR